MLNDHPTLADLIAEWRRYARSCEAEGGASEEARRYLAEQARIWNGCANLLEKVAVEMTVIARLGKDVAFDLCVGQLHLEHPPTIEGIAAILENAWRELDKKDTRIRQWGSLIESEDGQ